MRLASPSAFLEHVINAPPAASQHDLPSPAAPETPACSIHGWRPRRALSSLTDLFVPSLLRALAPHDKAPSPLPKHAQNLSEPCLSVTAAAAVL